MAGDVPRSAGTAAAAARPGSLPPPTRPLKLFISYARRDVELIERLEIALRKYGDTWRDAQLRGGQNWWDNILAEIEAADVVVLAISPFSLSSKACTEERRWAQELDKQFLQLVVREVDQADVNQHLSPKLQAENRIEYFRGTPDVGAELEHAATKFELLAKPADVGLARPLAPIVDLTEITAILRGETFDKAQQDRALELLDELGQHSDTHTETLDLIDEFLRRPGVTIESRPHLEQLRDTIETEAGLIDLAARKKRRPLRLEQLDENEQVAREKIERLKLAAMDTQNLIPIVGWGMTEPLLGPLDILLRQLAHQYDWPRDQPATDLAQIAQFVQAISDDETLRVKLDKALKEQLLVWNDDLSLDGVGKTATINDLLTTVWRQRHATPLTGRPPDPHWVLANLDCRYYVIAHPWDLMEEALTKAGKRPVVEVCWWNPAVRPSDHADDRHWPKPTKYLTDGFEPTVDEPLVYHVFGRSSYPKTMVRYTDEFLDFLINVSTKSPRDEPIPGRIREAIVESRALLLGFDLEDVAAQVLIRALVEHQGAEIEPIGAHPVSRGDNRNFLRRYFEKQTPKIGLLWGDALDVTTALADELELDLAPRTSEATA